MSTIRFLIVKYLEYLFVQKNYVLDFTLQQMPSLTL